MSRSSRGSKYNSIEYKQKQKKKIKANKKAGRAENRNLSLASVSDLYEVLSFYEMKNVVDLVLLYSDVNNQVIDAKKNTSKIFAKFTRVLNHMVDVIKNIDIELDQKDLMLLNKYSPEIDEDQVHLWNYFDTFSKTNDNYEKMNKGLSSRASSVLCTNAPMVKLDDKNMNQMIKLETLIEEFTELVDESGKTKNTVCRLLGYFLFCCNFACCRCSRFFQRGPCG